MGKQTYYRIMKDYFINKRDVVAVYLYGSFAKGLEKVSSDIDLAILFVKKKHIKKDISSAYTYEERLSAKLNRVVEVQNLNNASMGFIHRVLSEGKLIVSNDDKRRTEFEEDTVKRYFDMKPLLDEYYKSLAEITKKGELHVRYIQD